MSSDEIVANAVKQWWKENYECDVIAFFYQKYDFDEEWEWCEELAIYESSNDCETVIFENDFCEGQTCVKEIAIVPLHEVTRYYADTVLRF